MQDMYDIFKDERRGSRPKGPDAAGTGRLCARLNSYGAASLRAYGEPSPPRPSLLALTQSQSRHSGEINGHRP